MLLLRIIYLLPGKGFMNPTRSLGEIYMLLLRIIYHSQIIKDLGTLLGNFQKISLIIIIILTCQS